jgi:hypothetical protein
MLIADLHPVSRLRMSGATPLQRLNYLYVFWNTPGCLKFLGLEERNYSNAASEYT